MSRKPHHPPEPPAPEPGAPGEATTSPGIPFPGAGSAPVAATPPSEGGTAAPLPDAQECARLASRAAEADVLEDRLKRAQAEFVNESKRIARQAEQDRRFAVEQMAKDLVPLAEGLASAIVAAEKISAAQAVRDGVALVQKQLEDVLGRYGIELLRPQGVPFDPAAHEAILMVERSDLPANHVADLIRPGFRLHGRVVRPAQVTVAKAAKADAGPPAGA